ncbi:hypothetical protein ACJX0J_022514, partial [Zea mays]
NALEEKENEITSFKSNHEQVEKAHNDDTVKLKEQDDAIKEKENSKKLLLQGQALMLAGILEGMITEVLNKYEIDLLDLDPLHRHRYIQFIVARTRGIIIHANIISKKASRTYHP